jgi:hypothetical protein
MQITSALMLEGFFNSAIYQKLINKELQTPDKCPISTTMPYMLDGEEENLQGISSVLSAC